MNHQPTAKRFIPKLPVYPPAHMLTEHERDVDTMFELAQGHVIAVCPGGHWAQTFPVDGRVHTDHQPCLGAWWFVEVDAPLAEASTEDES